MQTVRFGRYPQEADGSVKDLEWYVLTKEKDRALLVTKDCIDFMHWAYWDESKDGWKKSSIRRFLNEDFLSSAFHKEERDLILPETNPADIRTHQKATPTDWEISEEKVTDQVFLLDPYQADIYFLNDEQRRALPTAYVLSKGGNEKKDWWLRTLTFRPDYSVPYATLVWPEGKISHYGFDCIFEEMVRPVIWVKESVLDKEQIPDAA